MADYKSYLAANILSEDRVITYRLLSRALKVHVNAAKEMLYEFHRVQNGKKPGSVHATYLISGTKREDHEVADSGKDGEDEYMQSSPFIGSSMPQADDSTGVTSVLSISLAREEDLDKLKSQYEQISSIHIYSLGPHPLKELQVLTDCTRELQTLVAPDDPVESYPTYGSIINPLVKRRTNRRPPPPAALPPTPAPAPAAKPKPARPANETSKPSPDTTAKRESSAKDFFGKGKEKSKAAETSNPSSKEGTPAPNPPTLKKESSSLFKAFAKQKPKLKTEGTDVSAVVEDQEMKDAVNFDDEDGEETYVPPVQKEESAGDRKSRKAREAQLKAMMEEDDDEEPVPTPEPEPEPEAEEEAAPVKPEAEKSPEPQSTVSGGRRRGKRRVTRKRTTRDEEGYLVTKTEEAWESFSEEEPAAPIVRRGIPSGSSSVKGKKGPEKKGQGSIMSFFGKK